MGTRRSCSQPRIKAEGGIEGQKDFVGTETIFHPFLFGIIKQAEVFQLHDSSPIWALKQFITYSLLLLKLGKSDPSYPVQKKRVSREFLRTKAHLRPRTNTFGAVWFCFLFLWLQLG